MLTTSRRTSVLPLLLLAACGEQTPAPEVSQAAIQGSPAAPAPKIVESPPEDLARLQIGMERLIPTSSLGFVRFESIQAFETAAREVSEAVKPGQGSAMQPSMLLHMMLMVEGSAELVDPDLPFGIAFGLDPMAGVAPTFILPTTDPKRFVQAAQGSPAGHETAVSGNYVGLSKSEKYSVRAQDHDLGLGMPTGVVALRIDLAQVIAQMRPMIEGGLQQMSQVAASAPAGGMDPAQMVEAYQGWAEAFLDSAETLDLAWDMTGSKTELMGSFTAREGSPMALLAPQHSIDLGSVLGLLDESEPLVFLLGMDMASAMKRFEPFLEELIQAYPEAMRRDLVRSIEAFEVLYPLYGNTMAGSGGFGPDGMRFVYYIEADDPRAALQKQEEVLGSDSFEPVGMKVQGPTCVEIDEHELTQFHYSFDREAMEEMMGTELSESDLEEMNAAMEMMYGQEGMVLSMGATAHHVVMVLGGDSDYLRAAMEKADRAATASTDLTEAVRKVDQTSASFVMQADLGLFTQQFLDVFSSAMGVEGQAQRNISSAPLVMYGAVDGNRWHGGASMDVRELAGFLQDVQSF